MAEALRGDLAAQLLCELEVRKVLGADERDVEARPLLEQLREDRDQLAVALHRVDACDERHDLGRVVAEQRQKARTTLPAVDVQFGQAVVHDVNPLPDLTVEGLRHGLADRDHLARPARHEVCEPPVPAEVVLEPDPGNSRAGQREGADDRRLDPVRVHDVGIRLAKRATELHRRGPDPETGPGRDHLGRDALEPKPVDERRVLEADHVLRPARPELLDQLQQVILLAPQPRVRRDERDRDRVGHRGPSA